MERTEKAFMDKYFKKGEEMKDSDWPRSCSWSLCGGVMVVSCMKYYSGLGRTSMGPAVKDHRLLRK